MRQCIYCRKFKDDVEFSLEHVIPQFMGGAYVSDKFKTRDVCIQCNSNLGLFVDAAFEKDSLVYSNLNSAAHAFFDPLSPVSLPLECMGISSFKPPYISASEICEHWIGPLGEQVFWIRPNDERLFWYCGGNPRTVKKQKSTAYFLFSERSIKNPVLSWLTFRDAFEGRPVKKIMCTDVSGADPKYIGFSDPDHIDTDRIAFFLQKTSNGKEQIDEVRMNINYYQRFMAKLAIGVSYCLFGESVASTKYMDELYKGLWFRHGDSPPEIRIGRLQMNKNKDINKNCGIKYGVSITVLQINDAIVINLNIGQQLNWAVQCAKINDLNQKDIEIIGEDGMCIVIFKPIGKCVVLSFAEFIAHKNGSQFNEELSKIEEKIRDNSNYFSNL